MAEIRTLVFPHRRNADGTFDSICMNCFLTVSHSKSEAELAESDKNHICDSSFLAERGMFNDSRLIISR
jgi:hypothetical protein